MSAAPAASEIVIGGKRVALRVAGERTPIVLTWHDHGISFAPGEGFNKKRTHKIDLVVWHWTGGEQEPPAMAEVLKTRGYGVEFAIARTGVIYQFADPLEVDTADAGGVNARSVGVEIVSYGMRLSAQGWKPPKAGTGRTVHRVRLHAVSVDVAAFYPEQLTAARALADGLSRALEIPRVVPVNNEGVATAKQLSAADLAAFKGHVGHYHLSRQKCDPGPDFMGELNRFFAATPAQL
jgi:hypothetical protein